MSYVWLNDTMYRKTPGSKVCLVFFLCRSEAVWFASFCRCSLCQLFVTSSKTNVPPYNNTTVLYTHTTSLLAINIYKKLTLSFSQQRRSYHCLFAMWFLCIPTRKKYVDIVLTVFAMWFFDTVACMNENEVRIRKHD